MFITDEDSLPVVLPFADFEEVFGSAQPAQDGQVKVQLDCRRGERELYVARQGRFNVEGYFGLDAIHRALEGRGSFQIPQLTHSQVQTLLGSIGHAKGYEVCIPASDVAGLDWSVAARFPVRRRPPRGFEDVKPIISEIDVVWVTSRDSVEGMFEVEHSTSIYSGLLRFNDILLTNPKVGRFSIVSDERRRSVFSRQLFRPTFRKSGLAELCSFLEYPNVYFWHSRVAQKRAGRNS